jgi:hypothetical protein
MTLQNQAYHTGKTLLHVFEQMKKYYVNKEGRKSSVKLAGIEVFESHGYKGAAYHIDTHPGALPAGIAIADLVSDRMVHQLRTSLGYPVVVKNTDGLTYIVQFSGPSKTVLPRNVSFSIRDMPAHMEYPVPIGVTKDGPLWMSLRDFEHVLVAGMTGWGKSTFLHTWIATLVTQNTPDRLTLYLIDPKGTEFVFWQNAPHLGHPVVKSEGVDEIIAEIEREIHYRHELLASHLAQDIAAYNRTARERLPQIVLIMDEVVVVAQGHKEALNRLQALMTLCRAAGVTIILATAEPRGDVLDLKVSNQTGTKAVFRLENAGHAKAIRIPQAEHIKHKGRLWFKHPEKGLVEAQGYFIPERGLKCIGRGLGDIAPALSREERIVGRILTDEFDGYWNHATMYKRTGTKTNPSKDFEGKGVSDKDLRAMRETWIRKGYLEVMLGEDGRRHTKATDRLCKLLGVDKKK